MTNGKCVITKIDQNLTRFLIINWKKIYIKQFSSAIGVFEFINVIISRRLNQNNVDFVIFTIFSQMPKIFLNV